MPMLAVGGVMLFAISLAEHQQAGAAPGTMFTGALKDSLARYWPVFALAMVYFAWRFWIFGSPWKVYPDSQLPDLAGFLSRMAMLKHVFRYPWGGQAVLWGMLVAVGGAAWLLGLPAALKRREFAVRVMTILLFCCFIGYLAAPASSFPVASDNGEGIRNLYFPWTLFSLFFGFAIASHRLRLGILGIVLIIALWGQWRLVALWQDTAAEMLQITLSVPALADKIDEEQFALLLLPDHVKAVPFVRNTQAAIVMPPTQEVSYLPIMVAMTPLQFPEWEQHLQNNAIGDLKGGETVFDREAFHGVYCWQPAAGRFHLLDAMPRLNDAQSWETDTMAEAVQAGCLLR